MQVRTVTTYVMPNRQIIMDQYDTEMHDTASLEASAGFFRAQGWQVASFDSLTDNPQGRKGIRASRLNVENGSITIVDLFPASDDSIISPTNN